MLSVAVMDSGITDRALERFVLERVNVTGEGAPDDTTDRCGHGTAVASTIHAIEPAAGLVCIKAIKPSGILASPALLAPALAWVGENRVRLHIAVVCMAFGDASRQTDDAAYRGSPICRMVADLRNEGVATVAPAGNRLWAVRSADVREGMAWPAVIHGVISVGAAEVAADGTLRLAAYSERVHTNWGDGRATTLFTVPGPPGGTSGAAAVATGLLVGARRRHPEASVDDLVADLLQHGEDARGADGRVWACIRSARVRRTSCDGFDRK